MTKQIHFDPSLYLVTDTPLCLGRPLAEVVDHALAAGVTLLQYRDKTADDQTFVAEAREIANTCHRHEVALIINDRADLVHEIGADGAHVGQDDLAASRAREILGDGAILGVSVFNPAEAREAIAAGADYIAVNGVFYTDTKKNLPEPLGLDTVREIADAVNVPVIAIGGINPQNTVSVIASGADGVAVVSAICSAPDIAPVVGSFLDAIAYGKGKRPQ
jgi:thiamine-phosphate pyrophosphorylase